jgi:predicted outer membrane protein
MSTGRITVSLPTRQIEAAKKAVAEGRAASVSAYVSEALDEAHYTLDDFVADMIEEFGPASPAAKAFAESVWEDARRLAEGTEL